MVRDDFWKLIITYVTSFCMLAGGLHWAFFFTILGSMTAFDVYAVDEIKQRLETTYELEEAKNVDGTEIYNKILDRNDQSTNNPYLEQKILNKDYGVGKTIELDQYPDVDFATEYKAYLDDGLGAKQQGKVPSMTNGNVDVQYYEKSSVTLARDKEGKIVTTVVPVDERGELKTSLEAKEAFSSQINRSDAEFNAPQNYGDENAYLNDMKRQYLNAGNAKTMESEAYRSIIKANNDNPAQRLKSNAYFLTQGNNALGDARDGKGIWAQTCKDETITEKEIVQVPVWEPQVCQKPNHQNFNFCEVTRTLKDNPYFERVNVSAKFGHSWGHRLTIEADFVTGTGKILSDSQPAKGEEGVVYAESIEKVDYDLFCSSGTGTFNLLSSTSWPGAKLNSDHDTTDYYRVVQEPSCSNGLKAILQVEDTFLGSYKDSWDLTAHFYFEFQTAQYVSEYTQNPKNCASQLGWKPGPYPCVGESCFKESAPKNEFCTFDEWEVIKQDTGNYPQWVIEGISQMFPNDPNPDALYGGDNNGEGQYHVATWKINAKGYSCDPLKQNDFCVQVLNKETEEFEEQCFNYEEFKQLKGSCQVYEDNSRCELVGKTCVEGWHDTQNDVCYMYSDSYRCDVSKPYEKTTTKTNNVCAGMLPCLGDDCDYGDEESSDDFENAVLMASISQTVADDSNCVNKDPNTCEIFPGEQEYCSWEVSGLGNNCCDAPSGINYIEMAMLGYKMMQTETFKTVSSTLSGGFTDKVGGMYSDFSAMLVDGWNTGSKVVVDFASSVMGDPEFMSGVAESVTTGGASVTEAINGVMHTIQQQVYSTLNNMLPEELAKMLFQEATAEHVAEEAATQVGDTILSEGMNQFLSIISFIGWIYTIYNVIKILANILTQCDENEQDMGVKIAQKQCFKVDGSYCAKDVLGVCYLKRQDWCCYSSMLARIIGEQGSKQLGKNMQSCPGFTIDEFSRIDFDRLDLSEWLSTMYEADILSTTGYDIERLTGTGRTMGNNTCEGGDADCEEMTRVNAENRAVDMFNGDVSDTANQLKDNFDPEQIDCSIYPRPLICEMQ